jgi:hypothetical protein
LKYLLPGEVTMNAEGLSSSEKDTIEREIRAAIGTLITGCETLDMDLAFQVFSDSPDFLMMATDGTLCDYHTYVDGNVEYLRTCSSFKLTTFRDEIRILKPDLVLFSWAYGAEATLESGEKDIVEKAGASFVFSKVEDEWKVVYYHESSLPPTRVEAGN